MMTSETIGKLTILGGGTSGWLAAAMLAHSFTPQQCRIEVVESAEIGSVGIGESTVPPFVQLIRRLGIDEQDFVRQTQATYKLGIQFVDWQQRRERYFHPFGSLGQPLEGQDFYQCWLKARTLGEQFSLQEFSPCSVMAERGRFFYPEQVRNSPIGGANYALHVDAAKVGEYLRRYALSRGVVRTEGRVAGVEQADNGYLTHLLLEDGRRIDGDFFIDCSGFKALLIGQVMKSEFLDWSQYLPCDRAIAVKTEAQQAIQPYTLATARKAGWTWRIPLQQSLGHGYVYSSKFCSDSEAKSQLMRSLDSPRINEPRLIPFTSGYRREIWKHNCLSLGLASGFIEPLESTAIHLIARGMSFFLRYFPDRHCNPALIREYNRCMSADYEEVRDFIVLHYWATQREDTAFWRWCKNITPPDSLRERIELFRANGALRQSGDELFRASSWQSVFEGMGIRPYRPNPRVDGVDVLQLRRELQLARSAIAGMVQHLPRHEDFLHRLQTGA